MLPDGNGLDLCRQWRADDALMPILMLTARGDPIDRVLGLELGADDYVAKPFEARELLARVRALLRRQQAAAHAPASMPARIDVGALALDLLRSTASVEGHDIGLSSIEFRLLVALAQRPGQAVDRQTLAEAVQPGNYRPLDRAVDVQIARLRRKLREIARADCIRTVRGEGYAIVPVPGTAPR
jgi:DNA-binding response OmpR family regulator